MTDSGKLYMDKWIRGSTLAFAMSCIGALAGSALIMTALCNCVLIPDGKLGRHVAILIHASIEHYGDCRAYAYLFEIMCNHDF